MNGARWKLVLQLAAAALHLLREAWDAWDSWRARG